MQLIMLQNYDPPKETILREQDDSQVHFPIGLCLGVFIATNGNEQPGLQERRSPVGGPCRNSESGF